ncbi:MAG: hypothetical protein ACM3XO_17865 [Bacteroidota bacterium]
MKSVLSPTEKNKQPADDLKQIRGIGPSIEQRLNQAGIYTFAQLAEMSNKNLAALFSNMHGLSEERIAEKGWTTQARQLIQKEPTGELLASGSTGQFSALFSVDLLLDNQNHIRRTHILHVQSRIDDSWAEWNKDRLAAFILENAVFRSSQKISDEEKNTNKVTEVKGDLHIMDLEIQAGSGQDSRWGVNKNEPFAIGLMLNLERISLHPGSALQYHVEVQAKNLSNGIRQKLGENNGIIESKTLVPLVVNCHPLPEGSYRLEACVVLAPHMEKPDPRSQLMAMTEGKVVRVG